MDLAAPTPMQRGPFDGRGFGLARPSLDKTSGNIPYGFKPGAFPSLGISSLRRKLGTVTPVPSPFPFLPREEVNHNGHVQLLRRFSSAKRNPIAREDECPTENLTKKTCQMFL